VVLVGEGTELESLRKLVVARGLEESVLFAGWVRHDRLPAYIQASSVCCIPHLKSDHTDTTIPNKLFDYMALGKPVAVSNLDPVQRIVERVRCGAVFQSGDEEDLASVLVRLSAEGSAEEMGERGRQAVLSDYNWQVDAKRLRDLLHGILHRDNVAWPS
jgi:glycosyltransferase involved in cell wall biosynthesis